MDESQWFLFICVKEKKLNTKLYQIKNVLDSKENHQQSKKTGYLLNRRKYLAMVHP